MHSLADPDAVRSQSEAPLKRGCWNIAGINSSHSRELGILVILYVYTYHSHRSVFEASQIWHTSNNFQDILFISEKIPRNNVMTNSKSEPWKLL